MTSNPIIAAIEERKAQLAKLYAKRAELEKDIQRYQGEISGLEHALRLIQPESNSLQASNHRGNRPDSKLQGSRRLSPTWRRVLHYLSQQPNRTATLDQMMEFAEQVGLDVKRNVLRSQMSIYSNQRHLESVGVGTYRMTDQGLGLIQDLPIQDTTHMVDQDKLPLQWGENRGAAPEKETSEEEDSDFLK